METNSVTFWIEIITAIIAFVIVLLGGILCFLLYKNKQEKLKLKENLDNKKDKKTGSSQGNNSVKQFMEFDEIVDNMIVRKNRQQYIMVVKCKGVNYDLLSEEEKIAVENGFMQFLNALRYPIQLYVQTRSLNLKDIIDGYSEKVEAIRSEIDSLEPKIRKAKMSNNKDLLEKLEFEKRRRTNILEYGKDITDYIGVMSLNKNVLQQNTYVVVSYYAAELGTDVNNYSKQELDGLCFNELYIRVQAIIRSLASAEVYGRVLDSEELAELLYMAYNRDDAEILQLKNALDAEFDSFYSTAPDILQKKINKIKAEIEEEAVILATDSMLEADRIRTLERSKKQKIKQRARELVEDYKEEMDKELYNETKKLVEEYDDSEEEEKDAEEKPKTLRKTRKRKEA